jgi:hypothetical protein
MRVATPFAGPMFCPAQLLFQSRPWVAGQGYSTLQRQMIQCPNNSQNPAIGNQSAQRAQAAQNPLQGEQKCYTCGEKGHFANQCPNPRNCPPQIVVSTPAPTRGANYVPFATR